MNLFASMILQSLVRIVIYADQFIVRQKSEENVSANVSTTVSDEVWGIDNTVSITYIFSRLITFAWQQHHTFMMGQNVPLKYGNTFYKITQF